MGVHKLWDLLEPCGRRVNIEALTGKRLAIDASVWVYQFIKAMRDERGEMLRNAHLIGFFRRICKLLFHRVRPIFVFDGASPALKRQTIAARRRQREAQESRFRKAAERLLLSQLRQRLAHKLPGAALESETASIEAARVAERAEEVQDRASDLAGDAAGRGPKSPRPPEFRTSSPSKRPPLPPRIARARESAAVRQDALFASSSSDSEAEAALEVAVPDDGQIDPEVLSTLPPSMQLEVL
ncbi:XPG N-terminal domain-containing protein, partial [Helicosporidium sp. ATCC 50920]